MDLAMTYAFFINDFEIRIFGAGSNKYVEELKCYISEN